MDPGDEVEVEVEEEEVGTQKCCVPKYTHLYVCC